MQATGEKKPGRESIAIVPVLVIPPLCPPPTRHSHAQAFYEVMAPKSDRVCLPNTAEENIWRSGQLRWHEWSTTSRESGRAALHSRHSIFGRVG